MDALSPPTAALPSSSALHLPQDTYPKPALKAVRKNFISPRRGGGASPGAPAPGTIAARPSPQSRGAKVSQVIGMREVLPSTLRGSGDRGGRRIPGAGAPGDSPPPLRGR